MNELTKQLIQEIKALPYKVHIEQMVGESTENDLFMGTVYKEREGWQEKVIAQFVRTFLRDVKTTIDQYGNVHIQHGELKTKDLQDGTKYISIRYVMFADTDLGKVFIE